MELTIRYIKNNLLEQAVRAEMSQYFFDTCKSDGKQRMSLHTREIPLLSLQKPLANELDTQWVSTKKEKCTNLNKEFLNGLEIVNMKSLFLDILGVSSSIINNTLLENLEKRVRLNRIHTIFLPNIDYEEFEQNGYTINKEPLSKEIDDFLTLINESGNEAKSSLNLKGLSIFSNQEHRRANSEKRKKYFEFVFGAIDSYETKLGRKSIGLKEISKKVPRWSHKLITDLDDKWVNLKIAHQWIINFVQEKPKM
uniref:Protein TIC 214 n=1 Tax=Solanum lycopersicum TaxID=4081 RepID=A0A3Q7EV40_SOLLC